MDNNDIQVGLPQHQRDNVRTMSMLYELLLQNLLIRTQENVTDLGMLKSILIPIVIKKNLGKKVFGKKKKNEAMFSLNTT